MARSQNFQFFFDPNGNLFVQAPEVAALPQIIGQPQNRIVGPDEAATFTVVAADTRALTYQWQFNSTNILGATNDAVLLQNVTTNNEGAYRVVLTNPSGSVTSAPAMLQIDNDGDGVGDSWELTYFPNLNKTATADSDGDGSSNLQEFLDGTDPTDPASVRYRLLVIRDGGSVTLSPQPSNLNVPSFTNGEPVELTAIAPPGEEPFHAWLGDIVTRSNPVTVVMTSNKTIYARFTPIAFTWTNVASGDWNAAANWTPELVPGSNDTVLITRSVTVTLDTPADCADFTLGSPSGSPTLTGNGALTVWGNAVWALGSMSGSGRTILETGAMLNIGSLSSVSLNTRTLENGGTIVLSGVGTLGVSGGAVITNRTTGLFRVESQSASLGGGIANGRFDNAGTFRKSGGNATATLSSGLNFNNAGTVEVQAGTLVWNGGCANNGAFNLSSEATNRFAAGGSGGGTFNAPATALVEWTGGTFTLNPGAQLNGDGLFRISIPAVVVADASFEVPNLDLIGGTLGGSGTVTVADAMNWTGGTMSGTGRTLIPAGVTLNLALASSGGLSTRTLENGGTVLWTGGGIGMNFGSVITNRAGALFHVQNAATLSSGAGANRFDNAGIFRKSANAGTTAVASTFNNLGVVEIQTGTLLCNGGFTNNGAVNLSPGTTNRLAGGGTAIGAFATPATALVEWTGGTFTLNSGAQLNGAGLYKINGGNATVVGNGDLTVENFDLVNNTWTGTGILTIANVMNWTAGTMDGSGRTLIAPTATLQLGSASGISLKRTLENGGNAVWTGTGGIILLGGAVNSVITNRPGALFHAQNSAPFFFAGGGCRFDNAGTFRKSASIGTTTIPGFVPFNNSGIVDIRSGILAANGGYTSTSNALLNCALGGTTAGTNYGQLQVTGTVTLNGALSVDFTNGFSPALNDSFTVLTAGTRSGTFANFSFPSNAVTMQLSNSPNSVLVRVTDFLASVPEPLLLPPEFSGTDLKLIWSAVSNVTYRVEFNPNLAASNWIALPGDVVGVSNTASKLDPLTSSNRLYRVRVVP